MTETEVTAEQVDDLLQRLDLTTTLLHRRTGPPTPDRPEWSFWRYTNGTPLNDADIDLANRLRARLFMERVLILATNRKRQAEADAALFAALLDSHDPDINPPEGDAA